MPVIQRRSIASFLVPVLLGFGGLVSQVAAGDPEPDACELTPPERRMADLLLQASRLRGTLRCRPELSRFASRRARDMARRGYFSHLTPERLGPNQLLRDQGYPLPAAYPGGLANTVESIAGGVRAPEDAWRLLTASASHREHLLGEDPGFADQDEFGIAYYRDIHAPHVDYWVIVIARRSRPAEPDLLCTPQPAECFALTAAGDPGPAGP